jgi:hypothetical protein
MPGANVLTHCAEDVRVNEGTGRGGGPQRLGTGAGAAGTVPCLCMCNKAVMSGNPSTRTAAGGALSSNVLL